MLLVVDTSLSLEPSVAGNCCARRTQPIRHIILHHDVCFSATHCYNVLKARGLSTHFAIDNDGTIFQFLDPALWSAWHAGNPWNQRSIGVDVSNACDLRHAKRYVPPRGSLRQRVQNTNLHWLAPYPVQIDALVRLLRSLCAEFGIPTTIPVCAAGRPVMQKTTVDRSMGILGHFHVSERKCDPFGLDWLDLRARVRQ